MTKLLAALVTVVWMSTAFAVGQPADTQGAVREALGKYAAVEGLEANLEIKFQRDRDEMVATSTLAVSRKLGWRLEDYTPGSEYRMINDFRVSYQFFPREKRALKLTADTPELNEQFHKPANELNPLTVLDATTVRFLGKETLNGEEVLKFEGTTTTQMMAAGAPVSRSMTAWIATADGLPRRTQEAADGTTVTTTYSGVKVNPNFKPEDFQFQVPQGVAILDMNEEMKKASSGASGTRRKP